MSSAHQEKFTETPPRKGAAGTPAAPNAPTEGGAGCACGYARSAGAVDSADAPAACAAPGPETVAAYEARAAVFKALGHPARLAMLDALRHGERCVCELRELVELDLSTVSKHLTLLKNAGVVSCRRQGTQMHYRLDLTCLPGFLECVDHFLRQDLRRRGEALSDAEDR